MSFQENDMIILGLRTPHDAKSVCFIKFELYWEIMKKFTMPTFTSEDIPSVVELQKSYAEIYPDARVIPGELYLSPGFENGRNVFCAFDGSGKLSGYAPLYPVLMRDQSNLLHTFWTEIKVHPAEERGIEIKDGLFERILLGPASWRDFPRHPIHLTFQYFPSETVALIMCLKRMPAYRKCIHDAA
jgi:hypothetical protein